MATVSTKTKKPRNRAAKKPKAKKLKHEPTTDHDTNFAQVAHEYALSAIADKNQTTHCRWVRLAAKRHVDDMKKRGWQFYYEPWYANDVCEFIEEFPHIQGKWDSKTIRLEPVQVFLLSVIFGWRRKGDGTRRFSEVYIEMARKAAKSTLTAAVALYCLTREEEEGPEIVIAATTGKQAEKVFKPARLMAQKQSEYREEYGVEVWANSITCKSKSGTIQPINSKSETQDGWNIHLGVLDEFHAHKDRSLYDVITSAFGSRDNPLLWIITTAGVRTDGVCYELRTFVTKILEGLIEADHYFGIIFTLDEKTEDYPGDDPLDESKWIKANPMIGITPKWKQLRSAAIKAIASDGSMVNFKTKHLNIWTTSVGSWLNIESWKKCDGAIDIEELKRYPCYGGLDLASKSDISAFALVWIIEGRMKCLVRYWLPESAIDKQSQKGNFSYHQWVEQRRLVPTPGDVTDYAFIEQAIREDLDTFDIKEIGFDTWNANATVTNLMNEGAQLVEVRQGAKTFHPAMSDLEHKLDGKMIDHGGDPVLSWMASNAVAKYDSNNNMGLDRRKSQGKIDGMAALLMALGRALLHVEKKPSIYATPGRIMTV